MNLKNIHPKTLLEAIDMIVAELTDEEIKFIKNSGYEGLHHGLGTSLRNNLHLWDKKCPIVKDIRKTYDLSHGDDCSGLLFTGIWTKVRGGNLQEELQKQSDKYHKHWLKSGVCCHTGEPLKGVKQPKTIKLKIDKQGKICYD